MIKFTGKVGLNARLAGQTIKICFLTAPFLADGQKYSES